MDDGADTLTAPADDTPAAPAPEAPVDPSSEGAIRTRVAAALVPVVDRALAVAVENAIVVAVSPTAYSDGSSPATDVTANTVLGVNPVTQEPVMVSDGTAVTSDGTQVPVSRDETHDSIDPGGALTPEAISRRQDLSAADADRVAQAQAELDTLNAQIKAVEDEDAAKEQELADLRAKAATAAQALQEAKDTQARDAAAAAAAAEGTDTATAPVADQPDPTPATVAPADDTIVVTDPGVTATAASDAPNGQPDPLS